jgi:hypothetical protein
MPVTPRWARRSRQLDGFGRQQHRAGSVEQSFLSNGRKKRFDLIELDHGIVWSGDDTAYDPPF